MEQDDEPTDEDRTNEEVMDETQLIQDDKSKQDDLARKLGLEDPGMLTDEDIATEAARRVSERVSER